MLTKILLVLVALSVVMIAVAVYFLQDQDRDQEAEIPIAVREYTTLRLTESGRVVGFIDTGGVRAWLGWVDICLKVWRISSL